MFQFENVYNIISNKEKMLYNICNSLTDIKPKYNGLNFYYQVETKHKNSSLNWDLVIKYNKKTIIIFLHKYTFNLTKERLEYIDLQKNTTLIHRTLAYKNQLDDLNNNVISEVLNVLNN